MKGARGIPAARTAHSRAKSIGGIRGGGESQRHKRLVSLPRVKVLTERKVKTMQETETEYRLLTGEGDVFATKGKQTSFYKEGQRKVLGGDYKQIMGESKTRERDAELRETTSMREELVSLVQFGGR